MKAKEIMKGDWAHCITDDSNTKIDEIYFEPGYVKEFGDGWCYKSDGKVNVLIDLEPIPLTDEFLLNNKIEFNAYDGYHVEIRANGKQFVGRVSYVHEIQHALRLCGLDDKADNIKIF